MSFCCIISLCWGIIFRLACSVYLHSLAIGEPLFAKKGKRHVKTSSRDLLKEKLAAKKSR